MELNSIIPWGRTLAEYQSMFQLTQNDLQRQILGCGDGPASFNAELTAKGGSVISIDPIYQFKQHEIRGRIDAVYDDILSKMEADYGKYIWDDVRSVENLGKIRMNAMNHFLDDYPNGLQTGRYRFEQLPSLSFSDSDFDLALCSHYLFLYSEQVSLSEHIDSLLELARVANEVRVYPLLNLEGSVSPHLASVMSILEDQQLQAYTQPVSYQFQKGADEMLVIKNTDSVTASSH